MALLTLGINHKTAPVEVREKVAFDPAETCAALQQVVTTDSSVAEAVILSTCNRTEIYCSGSENSNASVLRWISDYHQVDAELLQQHSYYHFGEDAARHIMRVASGLDSLVLGEPQILGQLKSAYAVAREAGTVKADLSRLFEQSFMVAKRVRTETAIGENPVSVAYASVSLARQIFADLSDSHALLIGAGKTTELVALHLKEAGIKDLTIANRTLARAQELASLVDGKAILLADIPDALVNADIVIAATASQLPILGKGAVERALKLRKFKPIFMVDIAIPRDIEPQVGDLADIYLYTVDDLKQVIDANLKSRQGAAEEAEHMIESGAAEFMYQLRALDATNVLRQFRSEAEKISQQELEKAVKALGNGRDPETVIRALARGLTNKLIHQPTVQVRKATAEGRIEAVDWLRELFELPGVPFEGNSER